MIIKFEKGVDRNELDKFWFTIVSNDSKKEYDVTITFDEFKNLVDRTCTCKFGTIDGSAVKKDMRFKCKHMEEAISLLFTKQINYLPEL
jgi:hypothetical protein